MGKGTGIPNSGQSETCCANPEMRHLPAIGFKIAHFFGKALSLMKKNPPGVSLK